MVQRIRELTQDAPEIVHVNEVLTMHMGPEFILVNLSVEFIDSANADQIEAVIAKLDRGLKESLPRVKRVFIEAEARTSRPAR